MKNLVIFSAEELYELIHDNPVVDKNSDTIYMSTIKQRKGLRIKPRLLFLR